MTEPLVQEPNSDTAPSDAHLLADLPKGSAIERAAYVSERAADEQLVMQFPAGMKRCAVLVTGDADQPAGKQVDLLILTIPVAVQGDEELLTKVSAWMETATPGKNLKSHMMSLQGAQIFWTEGRVAILALADRLEAIRTALIEVSFYEAELRAIEASLGETWPQLEADMPLAFEFGEQSMGKRRQLQQRFQQILLMRAKLARIAPHIDCPHLHPPTLASQVGERLRERLRMVHRQEYLAEQIDVFERVYELCGQRVSDFLLARSSNTLEWVIIILLLVQVLFAVFDYMTTTGQQ